MALQDFETIDMIVPVSSGRVVMLMTDTQAWADNTENHLLLLQKKVDTYVEHVRSGQVYASFPEAQHHRVIIDLFLKYVPDNIHAIDFLDELEEELATLNIGFDTTIDADLED